MGSVPDKVTPEAKARFLKSLERLGFINAAAATIGVTRGAIDYHRRKDDAFEEEVKLALQRHNVRVLRTLDRVAVLGTVERHYDKEGRLTKRVRRVDAKLLAMHAQRHNPELRPQAKVEVEARVEHSGEVAHKLDLSLLSDEELAALEAITAKALPPADPVAE